MSRLSHAAFPSGPCQHPHLLPHTSVLPKQPGRGGIFVFTQKKKASNYQATPPHTTSHASKVSKTLSIGFPKSLLPRREALHRLRGFCSRVSGVGLLYATYYFWTVMLFTLLLSPSSLAFKEYFCLEKKSCFWGGINCGAFWLPVQCNAMSALSFFRLSFFIHVPMQTGPFLVTAMGIWVSISMNPAVLLLQDAAGWKHIDSKHLHSACLTSSGT